MRAPFGCLSNAEPWILGLRLERVVYRQGTADAGAFRRSELVALDVADIEETEAGLRVTIRRSKTDQEAEGVTIAIGPGDRTYPVKALRQWLRAAALKTVRCFAL